jgi:hypothetical protein
MRSRFSLPLGMHIPNAETIAKMEVLADLDPKSTN